MAPVRGETASGTPALATVDTTVHMVFPNTDGQLIHLQYVDNPLGPYWGARAGLAARTAESPCLASLGGALHCVWKSAETRALLMSIWDPKLGWSIPSPVDVPASSGQITLFELNGYLQLLLTDASTHEIRGFTYDGGSTWRSIDQAILASQGLKSSFGVTAVSVNGTAFLTYADKDNKIATKKFSVNRWQETQNSSSVVTKTPGLAVLDNDVVCIWPDGSNKLQSMTRKAREVPSMSDWMSAIDSPVLISNLTIPGTHDSASRTDFIYARTQFTTITQQLLSGIRYFDIRAGYIKDRGWPRESSWTYSLDPTVVQKLGNALCAYHNFVLIRDEEQNNPVTIEQLFGEIYQFLATHKGEAVVVQLKQDPNAADVENAANFARDAKALIGKESARWALEATPSTIGNLRGKIQLVRRFALPKDVKVYGIDAMGPDWRDNDVSTIPAPPALPTRIQVQDQWSFKFSTLREAIRIKFAAVKTHLEKAATDTDKNVLYLNFTSGNGPPFVDPSELALDVYKPLGPHDFEGKNPVWDEMCRVGINKQVASYFNDVVKVAGRYGVIILDFPEEPHELILSIVKTNSDKFQTA